MVVCWLHLLFLQVPFLRQRASLCSWKFKRVLEFSLPRLDWSHWRPVHPEPTTQVSLSEKPGLSWKWDWLHWNPGAKTEGVTAPPNMEGRQRVRKRGEWMLDAQKIRDIRYIQSAEIQVSQTDESPRWFWASFSPASSASRSSPPVPMGVLPYLAFAVGSGSGLCSVLLLVHLSPGFHSPSGPFPLADALEVWCFRGVPGEQVSQNRWFSSWCMMVRLDSLAVESKILCLRILWSPLPTHSKVLFCNMV